MNFYVEVLFILQIVRGYMDQLKDKIEEETGRANEAEEEAKVWNIHLFISTDLTKYKSLYSYEECRQKLNEMCKNCKNISKCKNYTKGTWV